MKKTVRKVLALLLSLAMMLSLCSVAAFAATKETVKQYNAYTLLGDSMAAGIGTTGWSEAANASPDDHRVEVETSYGSIVRKAVGIADADVWHPLNNNNPDAKFFPYAQGGFRTVELRMCLDKNYDGDGQTESSIAMIAGRAYSADTLHAEIDEYTNAISKSDLITMCIGTNDIWVPVLGTALIEMYTNPEVASVCGEMLGSVIGGAVSSVTGGDSSEDTAVDTSADDVEITEETAMATVEESAEVFNAVAEEVGEEEATQLGLESLQKVATIAGFTAKILKLVVQCEINYRVNLPVIINKILTINPNTTLLCLAYSNPFEYMVDAQGDTTDLGDLSSIGNIFGMAIAEMNLYQMMNCKLYDQATFVSQSGIQFGSSTAHPTDYGHEQIADNIFAVLPEGGTTVKKASDGKWYYYNNGSIDKTFTGFASNENGTWRIVKGKVDFTVNGIVGNQKDWRYVVNGKVDESKNSVYKNAFGWWKVENGVVNFDFTGIAQNKYGTWYLEGGKVNFLKYGKVNYDNKTYTVVAGRVLTK